jgi:hypothetical protein
MADPDPMDGPYGGVLVRERLCLDMMVRVSRISSSEVE